MRDGVKWRIGKKEEQQKQKREDEENNERKERNRWSVERGAWLLGERRRK